MPERVVAALDDRPGIGLLATRLDVQQIIASPLRLGPHELIDTIEIDLTFSLLLADVAEVARLGDLVVASGLLRGERHRIARLR